MKRRTSIILLFLAAACSAPDKKAELEKLRAQKADIETKIASLEKEVGAGDTTAGEKAVQVRVKPVVPVIFRTFVELQGKVEAEENVALSSEMPGTVTKIHVKAGDQVNKGDVLAETDARAVQQQLAAMQTSLALVTQMFEKQKNLWDQKIGTEMQYLQAKSGKEALESAVSAIQEQVRMSKIISPISGTVDDVNIKIGQAIAPGMPAIRVINFNDLKVQAEVAETYMSRIKKGNEVEVLFPDMKDSIKARVSYASRSIDPLTRTFMVEVKLDNKKEYHPNMVARLRINDYNSPEPVVVVPVKFIQRGLNESYVYVAQNGSVAKRLLKLGREYAGMAEVSEGLKKGDLLIIGGYDLVNEGDRITLSDSLTTK